MQSLREFWEKNDIDSAIAAGKLDGRLASKLSEEVAARMDALFLMSMVVTRARGADVSLLKRQDGQVRRAACEDMNSADTSSC